MPAVAHDRNREIDRVAYVLEAGDTASTQLGAFHDAGVEFDYPVLVQARADACVEERLVFHEPDGGGYSSQSAIADLRPAGVACPLDGGLPERAFTFRDRPGAAVDDHRRR